MIQPLSQVEVENVQLELHRSVAATVIPGPWVGTSTRWAWQEPLYRFVKRALDVSVAAMLITLFAPLFLVVAVAIRLGSRGPAFFRQDRAGQGGKPFQMYKFRSMRLGAEALEAELVGEHPGSSFFKLQHDPRITKLGHILRRYSIDELPQLWNVLRGDMTLVGPRPLLMPEMKSFPHASHHPRFQAPPGLTGLWQVSGRSLCDDRERLQLDLEYVDRASLWLDLKILLRTIPAVLSGRGAY